MSEAATPAILAAVDQMQAEIVANAQQAYADYCELNPGDAVTLRGNEPEVLEVGIALGMNAAMAFLWDRGMIKPREGA